MPFYSSRNKGLNSKTHPLAILLICASKSRVTREVNAEKPLHGTLVGTRDTAAPSTATHLTITEVDERNFLPACFDELGLE